MSIQQRNDELVDILSADFQNRNESNFAWKSAASVLQFIPGVIAAWPMSALRRDSNTDRVRDIAGGGYHLTQNNACVFRYYNLAPVVDFAGANEYLSRVDGGAGDWADVTGTETHIPAAVQGLFLGGWFRFDDAVSAVEYMMAKWGAAGNRSYGLRRSATGAATFIVSNDGTATAQVDLAGALVTTGEWYCVLGRFDNTNNEIKVWVNGDSNTAVYNNAIFDGNADFIIGARQGGAEQMDGMSSLDFLGQIAVGEATAFSFYQQTRAMFGV
jgi:hypothetical protein